MIEAVPSNSRTSDRTPAAARGDSGGTSSAGEQPTQALLASCGSSPQAYAELLRTRPGIRELVLRFLHQTFGNEFVQQVVAAPSSPVERPQGLGAGKGASTLPGPVRSQMEHSFNADFSNVRVHESGHAEMMGVQAFAKGADLHFARGAYDPKSQSGRELLGHELAHSVQHGEGRAGTAAHAKGGVNANAGLEDEADRRGTAAARGELVRPGEPRAVIAAGADAPMQCMRPHVADVGRLFQIRHPNADSDPIIGEYLGPAVDGDQFRFRVNRIGDIALAEDRIVGYRPTVGGIHPPGQVRPPEQNVQGRDRVMLSEADLSGAMARQRQDPSLVDRMVVTTFENDAQSRNLYGSYSQNARDLSVQGVPILPSFDISNPSSAQRLSGLGEGANLHNQMPRVPRVSGYSTQQLVHDTLAMPQHMGRADMSVSVTAPDPSNYQKQGVHNGFYGLENGKAAQGTGMQLDQQTPDADWEKFGYGHRESTKDQSADVSAKRKQYSFAPILPSEEHGAAKDRMNRPKRKDDDDDHNGSGMGLAPMIPVDDRH